MRNLKNIRRSITTLPEQLPLTAAAWNGQSLICAQGPLDGKIELRSINVHNSGPLLAAWEIDRPDDQIVSLQYFADTETSCLICASGDIIFAKQDSIEIVGSIDAGITAAAWSPDEELVAITTGADTLLFMTREFDNVADIAFTSEDIKASNHVSVGWGKRETQFQGKRAKALRDPTMPEKVDEGLLSAKDNGKVTVSWRGDGAYVAVNSVTSIENTKRRVIRVYSREGALDSVSEPVDYLEGALSWRPAGNIIAGIQRLEDVIKIVFFERNGLRHGQFDLRLSPADINTWAAEEIELKWNIDSTVLAVCFADRVQLWTMGNYHYYLKREILQLKDTDSRYNLVWHPENALQFALIVREYVMQKFEFVLDVVAGPTTPPHDYGLVSVIDGKTIKLTPFRMANVPPPMCLHELELDDPAVDVMISPTSKQVIVLTEKSLSMYAYDPSVKPIAPPSLSTSSNITDKTIFPWQLRFKDDRPQAICNSFDTKPFVINILSSDESSEDREYLDEWIDREMDLQEQPWARIAWSQTALVNDKQITFGLTPGGKLYADERVLTSNCTSFLITTAHLILTTTQHLLKFVHLADVDELEVPADEPEKDERCRSIERGARLVTAIPSTYAVVLQMPRGNLETVYPRAMVLAGIRRAIEAKNYKKAFLACRNQRVDMNILHDHAPAQFLSNVDLFIEQVRKIEHIDLFLSTLKEEDVSQTMYKETSKTPKANGHVSTEESSKAEGSKINRICDAFLDVLQRKTTTNLQNIITANVCKSPPDLEAGLRVIAKLREGDPELAEKAAEHICFLADVNQLYDHALGLYDIDLALLIAQQSQKDPREYLPYMQSLQEMPTLRRQFTIDRDLNRHTKALQHLHALDAFDELLSYTQKHSLYAAAMDLYRYSQPQLNALMRLYADHLSANNQYAAAGVAYEFLNDHESALSAYRSANMWQQALSSASVIPLPDEEIAELATSLADTLAETKNYADAATIHLDYLHDIEGGTKLLCKGYYYATAIRLVALHKRPALLTEIIDPGLIDGSATMTELLADMKTQMQAQIPRLRELRAKKAADPYAFFAGLEEGAGADIPDNVSLAPTDATTSAGTFMTRYTRRTDGTVASNATRKTSKNRRREERKRARGKKGSVYEEEYLVSSIGRLIERCNDVNGEVARLVEGLMRRGMRERALAVERAMREVVEGCKACVDEVFGVEKKVDEGEEGVEMNGDRPAGGEGVYWDSLEEGRRKREPPIVKAFEGLWLLG